MGLLAASITLDFNALYELARIYKKVFSCNFLNSGSEFTWMVISKQLQYIAGHCSAEIDYLSKKCSDIIYSKRIALNLIQRKPWILFQVRLVFIWFISVDLPCKSTE